MGCEQMDLKAIQYVQEIVRCGSMTKASESLYLSQSALSQYIHRLEKTLGTLLFDRETNRLRLTPAGEIFLREGNSIFNAYKNMCQHIRQVSSGSREEVRMGVSSFYRQFFLPNLTKALKKDHPQLQLQLVHEMSSILQNLVRDNILDFCVTPFGKPQEGLSFEFLCTEEIMIGIPSDSPVLSQTIPGADFPSIEMHALADYPFIMMNDEQLFTPLGYSICSAAGFTPHVACELMGWGAITALVAAKMGVAFLPREIAKASPRDGSIVFCHIIAPIVTTRAIVITTAKNSELTPAIQNTINIIKGIASAPDFPF